ncbi:MAG: hypothetical protein DIKNOCCD_02126 [bacterium]|nr:hypothetical protein [bacterium]
MVPPDSRWLFKKVPQQVDPALDGCPGIILDHLGDQANLRDVFSGCYKKSYGLLSAFRNLTQGEKCFFESLADRRIGFA